MEPKFKQGLKQVTAADMGVSEDEFNNFLIDMFAEVNKIAILKPEIVCQSGPPITVKLTKKNYPSHLDLGDQSS